MTGHFLPLHHAAWLGTHANRTGFAMMMGAMGFRATRELVELCHIDRDKHVLDVGCGPGLTACYLAKEVGCRVVGLDIREKMITWSNERARREGIEDRVEFRIADAQNPPFEDAFFDAVIGESVTAFLEDKQRGINEYVRVTKPGGYVGLNEMTWMKALPPRELVEYYLRTTGNRPETSDRWEELLEGSGLRDVVVRTYRMSVLGQYMDGFRRFDFQDRWRTRVRFLSLAFTSPAFWRFAKGAVPSASVVRGIFEYLGYGIYVGRK